MTNLYYKKKTKVNLKRTLPKSRFMCKLSTYANVVNHFGFEKKYGYKLTPEKLLQKINRYRKARGLKQLNTEQHVIPTTDLDAIVKKMKLLKIKSVVGNYLQDPNKWIELMDNGSVIAPYHQQVYDDVPIMKSAIVKEIKKKGRFEYKRFIKFVDSLTKYYGSFDEGHVDLALEMKKYNGKFKIILANLGSTGNKYPIALDWNLFSKYLFWDWYYSKPINSKNQLPNKKGINKLRVEGKLKHNSYDFIWGNALIFSPLKS